MTSTLNLMIHRGDQALFKKGIQSPQVPQNLLNFDRKINHKKNKICNIRIYVKIKKIKKCEIKKEIFYNSIPSLNSYFDVYYSLSASSNVPAWIAHSKCIRIVQIEELGIDLFHNYLAN
jgi:hypothetical protein